MKLPRTVVHRQGSRLFLNGLCFFPVHSTANARDQTHIAVSDGALAEPLTLRPTAHRLSACPRGVVRLLLVRDASARSGLTRSPCQSIVWYFSFYRLSPLPPFLLLSRPISPPPSHALIPQDCFLLALRRQDANDQNLVCNCQPATK